jgi:hypothetical protein
MITYWTRGALALAGACALLSAACAQLPDTDRLMLAAEPRAVRLDGPAGPLSSKRSAAILEDVKRKAGSPDVLDRHIAVEESVAGAPLVVGNRVSLLQDGPATYRAMFAAIRGARRHINLETYIFEDDEMGRQFAAELMAKQTQGVQVNVMYDSVGGIRTPAEFFQRLKDAGVRVVEFNPVNPLKAKKGWQINNRDHRKLMVVDGSVAFLGGINISNVYSTGSSGVRGSVDPSSSGWRDTHVRIEGPVVADFQKLFMDSWARQGGEELADAGYFPQLKAAGSQIVRAIGSRSDDGVGDHARRKIRVPHQCLLRAGSEAPRGAGGGCAARRRRQDDPAEPDRLRPGVPCRPVELRAPAASGGEDLRAPGCAAALQDRHRGRGLVHDRLDQSRLAQLSPQRRTERGHLGARVRRRDAGHVREGPAGVNGDRHRRMEPALAGAPPERVGVAGVAVLAVGRRAMNAMDAMERPWPRRNTGNL